ncbi:hypothetical protein FHG87_009901 [Trinorchestia longiramus]|nr:hypothetical protein FHG87_009901 [Trinorchestia longiramus]
MENDQAKVSETWGSNDVACRIQGKTIVDPMSEVDYLYILEEDQKRVRKYEHDKSKGGKWILFFETRYLNSMWKKCCSIYRFGRLEGIKSLKVSTAKKNPRCSTIATGVIVFHCGPCDNKPLMLKYGMNIVHLLGYVNSEGSIPYKSDDQSAIGTRAMGVQINSLYKLPVARQRSHHFAPSARSSWRDSSPVSRDESYWRWTSKDGQDDFDSWRTKGNLDDLSQNIPSKRLDVSWLREPEESLGADNGTPKNCGHWVMFVPTEKLDETWKKAIELFRNGDLPDEIQYMLVSTHLHNYKSANGILQFIVETYEDINYLEDMGRNLARLMNYFYKRGTISFVRDRETICSVELAKLDLA